MPFPVTCCVIVLKSNFLGWVHYHLFIIAGTLLLFGTCNKITTPSKSTGCSVTLNIEQNYKKFKGDYIYVHLKFRL